MASQLHYASTLLFLLILWVSSDTALPKAIVETLPGFPGKLPFKLETGYIGVRDSENGLIFYYFFESEKDPKRDPLLLFLTGGPGCSAIHTIVYEMGPFTLDNSISSGSIPSLSLKPYSWSKVSNLLVIDQPIGTGFSYGKTWEAYLGSDTRAAELTYQFLKKWLVVHPEYLNNPLYIGGDSYTGIFVPLVVQEIYNGNEIKDDTILNIKGYILGNPVTDKFADYNNRVKYAHRMGLLSDSLYESAKSNCKGNYLNVDSDNLLCQNDLQRLDECLGQICLPHILDRCCDAWKLGNNLSTSLLLPSSDAAANLLLPQVRGWCQDHDFKYSYVWANDKSVQEALHIRKGTITEWVRCNSSMEYDQGLERTEAYVFNVKSTVGAHQNLTNKRARALIYSGDHDMVIPHTSTEEWIDSLGLTVDIAWKPWFVEGQVAGYTQKYSHLEYELTYATLKGGGHLPPEQKPEECFSMISRWFAGEPL